MNILTQLTFIPCMANSNRSKSSLFITGLPEMSVQLFFFHFLIHIVIAEGRNITNSYQPAMILNVQINAHEPDRNKSKEFPGHNYWNVKSKKYDMKPT